MGTVADERRELFEVHRALVGASGLMRRVADGIGSGDSEGDPYAEVLTLADVVSDAAERLGALAQGGGL